MKEEKKELETDSSVTQVVTSNPHYSHTYSTMMTLTGKYDRLNRIEKINMVRLGYLIKAGPNHPLIKAGEAHHASKGSDGWTFEPVYDHISKLFAKVEQEPNQPYGWLETRFGQPHGIAGRLNAIKNMSLQVTSRYIRHAISSQYYVDVDIQNCHVVLLAHYCETNKIRHSTVKRMIKHRDAIFEEVLSKNPRLTRDHVKRAVLSLLNGGTKDYRNITKKPDDLVEFANEMTQIIDEIAKINKELVNEITKKRKAEKRDYNIKGAVMCRILQDLENQCLEIMEEVCVDFGIPLEQMVPIHDGMQIPKEFVGDNLDEILRACEVAVKEKMGVDIRLVVKPMDAHQAIQGFEFPEDTELQYCTLDDKKVLSVANLPHFAKEDDIYDIRNYYLETTFRGINDLQADYLKNLPRYVRRIAYPKCYVVNKGCINPGTKYEEGWVLDLEKEVDIRSRYEKHMPDGGTIDVVLSLSGALNDLDFDRQFPIYKGITFNPNTEACDPRMFNMFTGFKAQEVDVVNMEYIQPMLNHIMTCWCNDDKVLFDYVMQWFRQAFAEPWEKTGVVILLHGDEGTGKGTLIDKFIKPYIYGEANSLTIQGLSKIVQRFNSALMNKLFVCANEVDSDEGWHSLFNLLKALITDPTYCPEKKGLDIIGDYPIPCNFIFTTNNHNSVKLGKTDRRYFCLETSNRYTGPKGREYFKTLYSHLAPDVVQRNADHFFTYCKRLPKVGELRDIPMTQLKTEMLSHAKTTFDLFLDDVKDTFASGEEITYQSEPWKSEMNQSVVRGDNKVEVPASVFYSVYKSWCSINNEKCKPQRDFGICMKRMVEYKSRKDNKVYIINLPIYESDSSDWFD